MTGHDVNALFGHGCIRVSEPAAYVLRNAPGDWNAQVIDAAMCGTQTLWVQLDEPVRVVEFYSTAVIEKPVDLTPSRRR